MWGIGNIQPEVRNNPMLSYQAMKQIHVLVVDHEHESLPNTVQLLELCQYTVTIVEYASAAIQLLSSGKAKFDLVMANPNSPDLHGVKLLQHAVNMDLPTILMSADDNNFTAKRAIANGAILYLKKPVTIDIIKHMWQHAVREKLRVMRERGRIPTPNYPLRGVEIREPIAQQGKGVREPTINQGDEENNNEKEKTKKKTRPRNDSADFDNDNNNNNVKASKKMFTEWTAELHDTFLNAIQQLGEGKCFPKEILELMNVPGLTRMQVASHLQKCRNENWRSPEERKMNPSPGSNSGGEESSQSKARRFGSMPRLGKSPLFPSNGVESSTQTRSEAETDGKTGKTHVFMENNNVSNHQQWNLGRVIQPEPSRDAATSSRRQNSDDLFNYPSMDFLYQDFPGITSQGYQAMNVNANQHHGPYHYHQNSTVPSMDTRGPWNSEKSSFRSDDSNTRTNE